MSEATALVLRHLRTLFRGRAFWWIAAVFAALLITAVLASPAPSGAHVPALWPGVCALVAWIAAVGTTGADALPADRVSGRTTWMRTLAPPGWMDRLAAAAAAIGAVLLVGCVAAAGLGVWALVGLEDFVLRTHHPVAVGTHEVVRPAPRDEPTGPPLTLTLPPVGAERALRRVRVHVRPVGDIRQTRTVLHYEAGIQSEAMEVATRGSFLFAVPAHVQAITLRSESRGVGLRIRRAAVLGEDRAPAWPIALRVLWIALLVASLVPWGVACSRFTTSATAGGLVICLLLLAIVRRPLLDLVQVMRTGHESQTAVSLLEPLGAIVPDLPLLALASDTADGILVPFADAAPWGRVVAFALVGLALVWLPLRRERA